MANLVANYAAKKLIGAQMEKYKSKKVAGDDDPYFTMVTDRHGKPKKVKKQIPDYIPTHDATVLAKAKKRAYHLDCSLFELFGVRFGWSSVIGIIPEIGDVIDMYFAAQVVRRCQRVDGGLPAAIVSQMWLNVIIDFVIGLIPFLGDLVDAAFRCNTRNVALLEKHLKEKHGPKDKAARDRSGLEAFSDDVDPPPYVAREDMGGQAQYGTAGPQQGRETQYSAGPTGGYGQQPRQTTSAAAQASHPHTVREPQQAKQQPNQQGGGWFSWLGRDKQEDVERGQESGTVRR